LQAVTVTEEVSSATVTASSLAFSRDPASKLQTQLTAPRIKRPPAIAVTGDFNYARNEGYSNPGTRVRPACHKESASAQVGGTHVTGRGQEKAFGFYAKAAIHTFKNKNANTWARMPR